MGGKIGEDEYAKGRRSSNFIGVGWHKSKSQWMVSRRSKIQRIMVHNGCFNADMEIDAAHASDNLARELMKDGEEGHKLNFPKDETEAWTKKETSSKYIGVSWSKRDSKWQVGIWSKMVGKMVHNGRFSEEIKAAHASDTLARELINNGGESYKLNFPNDETEVWPEEKAKSSKYFGVRWHKSKWKASRWSKIQGKTVDNGYFDADEETKAAHASDTLAREFINNGEEGHKLNFSDDETEVWPKKNKKRKRTDVLKLHWTQK